MAPVYHGGLPTAVLHGRSPPPYTFLPGDLNLLPKIWSKSVVHGPDPFKDALKRLTTTAPPPITTTHHDCGLPLFLPIVLCPYRRHPSPPLYASYSMFKAKFEGKASVLKHGVDKMRGCTIHG